MVQTALLMTLGAGMVHESHGLMQGSPRRRKLFDWYYQIAEGSADGVHVTPRTELALKMKEENPELCLKLLVDILRTMRSGVENENLFWAYCCTAECLLDLNRPHQALDLLDNVVNEPGAEAFTRILFLRHRVAYTLREGKCRAEE